MNLEITMLKLTMVIKINQKAKTNNSGSHSHMESKIVGFLKAHNAVTVTPAVWPLMIVTVLY